MEYIRVTKENLEKEHICCAISNNKDVQVSSKKAWLADRFDEGLVFLKSVERGKCFIEYIPAENAWVPIDADGYMYIDCLWVSGSFKGHGYLSKTARKRGVKGCAFLLLRRRNPSLQIPGSSNTKDLLSVTRRITEYSCGICLLTQMQTSRSSKNARSIRTLTKKDMSCTTPPNVRLTPSMCRFWRELRKRTAYRSRRFILRVGKRRRVLRHRSRITLCFATGSMSRMSR